MLLTKGNIKSLEDLVARFAIDVVTKEFYNDLFKWYDNWAINAVKFPQGSGADVKLVKSEENRIHLIRLITRLIFVWFIKQKKLIPDWIFDKNEVSKVLNSFKSDSLTDSNYYNGVIQNLFFATLNKPIAERGFAKNSSEHYGIKTYYRDQKDNPLFDITHDAFVKKFERVPFLNGGIFECLDKRNEREPQQYHDGFSQESSLAALVPNSLFFGGGEHEGLIELFNRYNFTVEENTPQDIDIALDPELLGRVFENLLGTYNEETNSTARKESGSFYTPREIVEYMVDVSLKEYLKGKLPTDENEAPNRDDLIEELFSYHAEGHHFNEKQIACLIQAINDCKILDPACGSGAFPMGMLHKIVFLLARLDPNNKRWKERQIKRAELIDDAVLRDKIIADIEAAFEHNELDYGRKLYLIENCIYGVDIQPIAIQISKLRFFISLIVSQKVTDAKDDNYGILPLPNLETKFVAANTLIGVQKKDERMALFENPGIEKLQKRLLDIRHRHFNAKTAKQKFELRKEDKEICADLVEMLKKEHYYTNQDAAQMSAWDPYNQNVSSVFFDPYWMFGIKDGFDVVIGNPPYVNAPTMVDSNPQLRQAIIDSKRFVTLYQKWDLYIPFMELGIQLLAPQGQFAMIAPYQLTNQTYAKKLREFIVNEYNLIEIVDLNGTKVFENTTISNCILFISKSPPNDSCFISHINENKEITRTFRQLTSDLVPDEKTFVWNLAKGKRETNRHSEMNVLGDFCYISVGMVLNADEKTAKGAFSKDDLVSEAYDKVHCRKYIEAKDIERYRVKRIRYLEYNTERCPDKLRRPTFRELYNRQKLVMNCLGLINATIDETQFFLHNHSLYCAVLWKDLKGINNKSISASVKRYSRFSRKKMEALSEQMDLRYLLGLLNSKYASALLSAIRGGDYHIYPEHVRNLPVPAVPPSIQQPVIDLVDKILAAKAASLKADTSALERQIDNLVYCLYSLTWEEVKVIEPEFPMNRAEYEGIEMYGLTEKGENEKGNSIYNRL
jgi:hypothetical protein